MDTQNVLETKQAAPVRQPAVERFLFVLLFTIVAGVTLSVVWKIWSVRLNRPVEQPVVTPSAADLELHVPDFSLIDKDGNPVTRADLEGQVWVANFFFTSCPAQCPAMNMRMAQIQRALPPEAAAKLISITVDPDNDSLEVLADYAKTFHAKDGRWLFLTGDKQEILRLAREGFKLPAGENPNDHSLRLALVDRSGRIRGYYNSTEDASVAELQKRLFELLDEK